MKLKKFNIFGISASWPFWLVDGIAAAAIGRAIYYNYWVIKTGLGVGLPVLLTVLGVFLAITAIYYLARWAFSKTIDGQTEQGTFVIINKEVKKNMANGLLVNGGATVDSVIAHVGVEIGNVKDFWFKWYNSADGIEYRCKNDIAGLSATQVQSRLDSVFNGGFIIINPKPFIQQSSMGPMAWLTGPLMGLQKGNQACVVWDPTINPGLTALCNITRHETGHMALEALGIPDYSSYFEGTPSLHHEIFKQTNYGA